MRLSQMDRGRIWYKDWLKGEKAADCFYANQEIDPYFAALLEDVKEAGIPIEAMRCLVSEEGMVIDSAVPIMQMKEG